MNNKYNDTYLGRLGNALSQLAHCISGGASDVSISGKTGYKTVIKKSKYWNVLRIIIDFSFFPIDGKKHCENAYLIDKQEKYSIGEGLLQDIICTIFVVLFCPIIAIVLYIIKFFSYEKDI